MDLQLKHKKTLITGATAGIGYAVARLMAAEGAEVIITGRTQEKVDKKVQELKEATSSSTISGFAVDFTKKEEVDALIEKLPELDILVNNVGIYGEQPFTEISDEDWFNIFEVNVMSGIRLARYYFPKMLEKNQGRIIFISSESAIHIPEDMIHYGMSKTAQLAVSRGLARLTQGTQVTVNAVLPGPTMSQANEANLKAQAEAQNKTVEEVMEDFFTHKRPTSLIRRFADPEEVASMIAYVASPLASATNGAALRVDGGVVNSII